MIVLFYICINYIVPVEKNNRYGHPNAKSQYVPDPKMITYILENFLGYFATLKNNQTDTLDEEKYKWFLEQLHNIIDDIKTVLPSLLTDEQVKEKQASFVSVFDNPSGPTF